MSPAASFTTSPGTSSPSGISTSAPPRTTVAVTLIIAFSFAAAASAFASWMNRSETPRITMSAITVPPRQSPVAKETADSTASRITSGFTSVFSSRTSALRPFSSATAFGPNSAKRASAVSGESPFSVVSMTFRISAGACLPACTSRSDTRMPFAFRFGVAISVFMRIRRCLTVNLFRRVGERHDNSATKRLPSVLHR